MTESSGSKLNRFHWQLFANVAGSKQTHKSAVKYNISVITCELTTHYVMWVNAKCKQKQTKRSAESTDWPWDEWLPVSWAQLTAGLSLSERRGASGNLAAPSGWQLLHYMIGWKYSTLGILCLVLLCIFSFH